VALFLAVKKHLLTDNHLGVCNFEFGSLEFIWNLVLEIWNLSMPVVCQITSNLKILKVSGIENS
jgi:hypothetical protein